MIANKVPNNFLLDYKTLRPLFINIFYSHTQQIPYPAAQGPAAVPPLSAQSGAAGRQVPVSVPPPVALAQAPAWSQETTVNKDKTKKILR